MIPHRYGANLKRGVPNDDRAQKTIATALVRRPDRISFSAIVRFDCPHCMNA
jgi:hypothetical protein